MSNIDKWQASTDCIGITRKRRSDAIYPNRQIQQHAARSYLRALNQKEFIGIDGEGVTRQNGYHDYVLLSVGSESLHHNDKPLYVADIFQFLWDCFLENPNASYVGFYLGYDFTMWLKSLPKETAIKLLSPNGIASRRRQFGKNPVPFPVRWDEWEFDILAMKRFKLRKQGSKQWMYICDAGPFFQTSFLTAINPKSWPEPICTDEEYEIIREGKTRRNVAQFDTDMIRYNVLENEILARVMCSLNDGFTSMGVTLNRTRWYGPGQAAQSWLNLIHAPDIDIAKYEVPQEVQLAARASYYGGWFEIPAHGHIPGTTFEYDINSAYPYATSKLPCLEHGEWERGSLKINSTIPYGMLMLPASNPPIHGEPRTGADRGTGIGPGVDLVYGPLGPGAGYSIVRATVHGSHDRFGVAPCRTRKGAILRPHNVRGWYWLPELITAHNAGAIDSIEIHDAWTWLPSCDHKPFASIAQLYNDRLKVGKNTPLGKALKLIYNSVYGKIAQSVGDPRYSNPIYASLITSTCRTMIWEAIASHPDKCDAVTMIATDGLFLRSEHPGLSLSDKLGDWSVETHTNLCQFMPGLYWDDTTRNQNGRIKSRGIHAEDLRAMLSKLDDRWFFFRKLSDETPEFKGLRKALSDTVVNDLMNKWPGCSIPISFGLVSAKLAIHRNKWSTAGNIEYAYDKDTGERIPKPRILSGDPSDKRCPETRYVKDGILWTKPYYQSPDGLDTVPYEKRFGLDLEIQILEDNALTESGQFSDELYDWIKYGND